MNLYPYSEIVITSSTLPQANKMVEDKIRDELIKKLSKYLLYMYDKEYLIITKSDDGYKLVNTLNGSILRVLPCLDSSRGVRATMLVYEECRLLKRGILDSVFEKMAHPRQAKYLQNPKYLNNKRWLEECQSIYITSARYRFEWFWGVFKECVTGYYIDKRTKYNIFAGDIFMAIDNGLKTWGDFRKARKMSGELDYRMEDLNEMIGQAEDAFFKIQSFKENQVLKDCFKPPSTADIYGNVPLSMSEKPANEIRLVIADLAFTGDSGKEKNDHTVFMCMSLHWKKFRFERHLDYIETRPGGGADKVVLRLKELFWDYQADYLVMDARSGGEAIFDFLSKETEHPERGSLWNPCGFTVVQDRDIQVAPWGKIEELANRTVDLNALPCIIPIVGTSEFNSLGWQSLKKNLETNNIKFLVSMQEAKDNLTDTGDYFNMTSDDFALAVAPYGQTDETIQECVNLSAEYRDGKVKLVEPRSGFKDRAVVLSYGNIISERLDNKYAKAYQKPKVDFSAIQCVW